MKYILMLLIAASLYAENCNKYNFKIEENIKKSTGHIATASLKYSNLALVYIKLKEICLLKQINLKPKQLGHDRSFGE